MNKKILAGTAAALMLLTTAGCSSTGIKENTWYYLESIYSEGKDITSQMSDYYLYRISFDKNYMTREIKRDHTVKSEIDSFIITTNEDGKKYVYSNEAELTCENGKIVLNYSNVTFYTFA